MLNRRSWMTGVAAISIARSAKAADPLWYSPRMCARLPLPRVRAVASCWTL